MGEEKSQTTECMLRMHLKAEKVNALGLMMGRAIID